MNGEKKFVLCIIGLIVLCVTILYVFLFLSLWPYRMYVGLSLLGLISFDGGLVARSGCTGQAERAGVTSPALSPS
jgi:hypothetical protein